MMTIVKHLQKHCRCGEVARPNQRNCKACHAAANRRYQAQRVRTPEQSMKANARSYAKVMLKRGHMQPQPCLLCGSEAEMHHPDYAQPRQVLWLCRDHHLDLHAGRLVLLEHRYQPAVQVLRAAG